MRKPTIEACNRLMDCWYIYGADKTHRMPKYHVQIKGHGGYWSCGRTIEEAVESLVSSHKEMFKNGYSKIIYLGELAR